ncbi:MAG: hypothetical protein JW852_06060 [Spirochaetales bacterium]|nr:hypothetical protein [Spirochaetales bacterium]
MAFLLVALAIVVASAVRPVRIGRYLELGPATVPLLVLGGLLILGVISFENVAQSLFASNGNSAWKIIVLFFCVAYASTSTDITGLFDFIAYHLVVAFGGSGRRLIVVVYLLASFLTVFTSNDIVILTLTPILFYVGKHAKVDVRPLLFAQFFGANTLSMLLVVGNPTNIIIAGFLGIGFVPYLQVMWLPTLTAFVLNLVLLLLVFRSKLPHRIELHPDSMFSVRNWADAGISAVLLAVMFVFFVIAERTGVELWLVAALAAGVFTLEDTVFTVYYAARRFRARSQNGRKHRARLMPGATLGEPQITAEDEKELQLIPRLDNDLYLAHMRVPWKILPFIVACFVLVDRITAEGAGALAADWLFATGTNVSVIMRTGSFSAILANLIVNQPMSIFVSRAITLASDGMAGVSQSAARAAGFATVIASNLAANLTVMGALAGLMWRRILDKKGINVSYRDFLSVGLRITPLVLAASLAALALVLA